MIRMRTAIGPFIGAFQLQRHTLGVTALLIVAFYVLYHFPSLVALREFDIALPPLISLYLVEKVLLRTAELNSQLATLPLSPANYFVIYPPGLYMLTWALGDVRHMFLFLFAVQLTVPFLLYALIRPISSMRTSLVGATLASYYLVSSAHWTPDFVIQPIMILVVLLLYTRRSTIHRIFGVALVGILLGLIVILKHNIGLFFLIACIGYLFFRAWKVEEVGTAPHRWSLGMVAMGFLMLGAVVLARLPHFDEVIFYLFPYFPFWGAVLYLMLKNRQLGFDLPRFCRESGVLVTTSLALPVVVFLLVGSVVGYRRYWYTLFEMGFEYIQIWDKGILEEIRSQVDILQPLNVRNIHRSYVGLIHSLMFGVPFFVNCLALVGIVLWIRRRVGLAEMGNHLSVISLGIIGVLMLFPLEGEHILASKFFLFGFILLYLAKSFSWRMPRVAGAILLVALFLPIPPHVLGRYWLISQSTTSRGSAPIQKAIGLPLVKRLADALQDRIDVVQRSIRGKPYYVVSSGLSAMTLLTFVDNGLPQFYVMRKGTLNREVTDAIIASVSHAPFVIVSEDVFRWHLDKQLNDPFLGQILSFVQNNYVEVDRYDAPTDPPILKIGGFIVMEKAPSRSLLADLHVVSLE